MGPLKRAGSPTLDRGMPPIGKEPVAGNRGTTGATKLEEEESPSVPFPSLDSEYAASFILVNFDDISLELGSESFSSAIVDGVSAPESANKSLKRRKYTSPKFYT